MGQASTNHRLFEGGWVDNRYPAPSKRKPYKKIVGEEFIDLADFYNVNWQWNRRYYSSTPRSWHPDVREAHRRAKEDCLATFDKTGLVDGQAVYRGNGKWQYHLRLPQIGDYVEWISATNESDQLWVEYDKTHDDHDERFEAMIEWDWSAYETQDVRLEPDEIPISQTKTIWDHENLWADNGNEPQEPPKREAITQVKYNPFLHKYYDKTTLQPIKTARMRGNWVKVNGKWKFRSTSEHFKERARMRNAKK